MNFKIIFREANIIEPENFLMDRKEGSVRYMFFHFHTSVVLTLNGKEEVVNPGGIIIFKPDTPQHFIPNHTRLNHDYVDFVLLDEHFFEEIHLHLNQILYPRISQNITSTITKLKQISNSIEVGKEYEIDALFTNFLLTISRKLYHKRHISSFDAKESIKVEFEQLRLRMFEDPLDKTVTSLASEIGFSYSYFNRIYKMMFKISPIDDLNNARVSYVKNNIDEETNIAELSRKLGFATTEYFYVWFKKQIGLTPKEFIKTL